MIYIKDPPQVDSVKEFINKIVYELPWGLTGLFPATYRDPECTDLQCKPARRSFSAICELCKSYFPECRDKDVAIALAELCFSANMKVFMCPDINKWVFFKKSPRGFLSNNKEFNRSESLSKDFTVIYNDHRRLQMTIHYATLYKPLETKDNTGFAMTDFLSLIENDQQTAGS